MLFKRNKHFNSKNKNIKILKANSTDYSNYLIMKKINNKKRKFALFLEQPHYLMEIIFIKNLIKMNLEQLKMVSSFELFLNI